MYPLHFLGSVSYTHLDVYKRQVYCMNKALAKGFGIGILVIIISVLCMYLGLAFYYRDGFSSNKMCIRDRTSLYDSGQDQPL